MRTHFHFAARLVLCVGILAGILVCSPGSIAQTNTPQRRTDANGNSIRRAPTGHISNYDESKIGSYTLPDPLRLQNGKPVRDAKTWMKQRRPEILKLYETEIYGRIPKLAPQLKFKVAKVDTNALDGTAVQKEIVGHIGNATNAPAVHVHLYLPRNA